MWGCHLVGFRVNKYVNLFTMRLPIQHVKICPLKIFLQVHILQFPVDMCWAWKKSVPPHCQEHSGSEGHTIQNKKINLIPLSSAPPFGPALCYALVSSDIAPCIQILLKKKVGSNIAMLLREWRQTGWVWIHGTITYCLVELEQFNLSVPQFPYV